tara:strand:- start:11744 stop:11911 length:168 start_codon:yes stop_codon:yes gene_type:complete
MKHHLGYLHQVIACARFRLAGNGVLAKELFAEGFEFGNSLGGLLQVRFSAHNKFV